MPGPSVTYTFSNATTADATQVNTNFSDLVSGLTDGTKDLTISALTAGGTSTLNGNVNLGNATGDDITITGRIAADIDPKTASATDLGDATQLWQYLYVDNVRASINAVGDPSYSFHADTNTGMYASGADLLNFATGGVERLELGTATIFNDGAADVDFRIEGTSEQNLVYVDAGANVVAIGTTGAATAARLHVKGADNLVGSASVYCTNAAGSVILHVANNGEILAPNLVAATDTGNNVHYTTATGEIRRVTSARKYKHNIAPCSLGLDFVQTTAASQYLYNGGDIIQYGFIGDDFVDEHSEFVIYGKENEVEGFKYNHMHAVHHRAIQELAEKIAKLEAQLAALTP